MLQPNHLFMRPFAGVDTDIIWSWARNFINETAFLRRHDRKLLLDRYSCHVSFKTLSVLKENGVIFAGLPVHMSNVQPLDVRIFGPLKEEFRCLLNRRTIKTSKDTRNDISTMCELLCLAYQKCVVAPTIIGGFRRSGL